MRTILLGLVLTASLLVAYLFYVNTGKSVGPDESDPSAIKSLVSNTRDTADGDIVELLSVAVQDANAVVSINGGQGTLVKIGDTLEPTSFRVVQISQKKLVLRDNLGGDMIFVYVQGANGKSRMQRLSATLPLSSTPVSVPVLTDETH